MGTEAWQNRPSGEHGSSSERRIGVSHPVIEVINSNLPIINERIKGYDSTLFKSARSYDDSLRKALEHRDKYNKNNFSFLADAFVNVGPFPLEPLDIALIWSRGKEMFTSFSKNDFPRLVSTAYTVQDAQTSDWKNVPRQFFEKKTIPEAVHNDVSGIANVRGKVRYVLQNAFALYEYVYGLPYDWAYQSTGVAERIREGDSSVKAEIDKFIVENGENAVTEIAEDFSIGLTSFNDLLSDLHCPKLQE